MVTQAKNASALVDCYYRLEEFDCMAKLIRITPENSPLLLSIGDKFQTVGMSKEVRKCHKISTFFVSGLYGAPRHRGI